MQNNMNKKILIILSTLITLNLNAEVTKQGTPGNAVISQQECVDLSANTADGGIENSITFSENGIITDVKINVQLLHDFRGDMGIDITYNNVTTLLVSGDLGSGNNLFATFDSNVAKACDSTFSSCAHQNFCNDLATSQICAPDQSLSAYNGMASNLGPWTLRICDEDTVSGDDGSFDAWSMTLQGQSGDGLPVELINFDIE